MLTARQICTVRLSASTIRWANLLILAMKPVAQPLSRTAVPGSDILRRIHRGGQGVVYEAIQKSTRQRVAIETMREGPFAAARSRPL